LRMRFKAVLFDLDGTLLDTIEDLSDAMNAVLVSRGLPTHDASAYRRFVGDGVRNLVIRSIPEAMRAEAVFISECAEGMREIYAKCWKAKTRPYRGIPELLSELAGRDVKMAVLSNKSDDLVEAMLAFYFKETHFDAAFGKRPAFPLKPDPAVALEIGGLLGVPPEAFAYLGDTDTDMLTARAAGMYPVGALWGFRSESELRNTGARLLVREPLELLQLFPQSTGRREDWRPGV
jgi:phosphoglycolate phosphatase